MSLVIQGVGPLLVYQIDYLRHMLFVERVRFTSFVAVSSGCIASVLVALAQEGIVQDQYLVAIRDEFKSMVPSTIRGFKPMYEKAMSEIRKERLTDPERFDSALFGYRYAFFCFGPSMERRVYFPDSWDHLERAARSSAHIPLVNPVGWTESEMDGISVFPGEETILGPVLRRVGYVQWALRLRSIRAGLSKL